MIVIKASDKLPLSLAPETETDAKVQQMYVLINTILGECPLYRDFGVSHDYLHMPINMAKTAYTLAITEAFRKYAPDVTLENIRFETNRGMEGILSPIIEVSDIE